MERSLIKRSCETCGKDFETRNSETKRGYGKFCSRKCSANNPETKTREERQQVNCCNPSCDKKLSITASSLLKRRRGAKSGLIFCTRACKDLSQSLAGNIKEIMPSHYATGSSVYRDIAIKNKPNLCDACGYSRIPEVLEVHHIDRNRDNNSISNLRMLCPTCHQEEHFLTKSGKWARTSV